MPKLVNRQWLLAARPKGMVKTSDFSLREAPVTPPGDGEVLVRNLYLAFEPAMRGWMEDRAGYIPPVPLGDVMRGMSVGQVVESNHPDYKPGDFVSGMLGWQEYACAGRGSMVSHLPAGATLTQPLSVLGITGITAYFGLLDLGKPQAGETVVVRGAGVPRLHGRGRGDLICVVEVEVPKRLSREQKRLLKELDRTFGES